MIRTGIYGGSFNPIHRGHIELGQFICNQGYVDELWFLVSPQNPFKKAANDLLEDQRRLQLAQIAVKNEARLQVCDIEFRLPRPSYMYKTMEALEDAYPDRCFTLIIGADNWLAFDRWAEYQSLLAKYDILVFPRTGYPVQETEMPDRVQLLPSPIIDVSATEIRERIKQGRSAADLLTPDVWTEIQENGDYR